MWRGQFILGVGALLVGCGSDGDSASTPVTQCEHFAEVWCGRAINCLVEVGRLPSAQLADNLDACTRVAIAAVPCDKAVAVGATYDTCISSVESMACSSWDVEQTDLDTVVPPSSCNGVVKVTP